MSDIDLAAEVRELTEEAEELQEESARIARQAGYWKERCDRAEKLIGLLRRSEMDPWQRTAHDSWMEIAKQEEEICLM
jgi:hypothetical protein